MRQLVLLLHAHLPDCRRPDHAASLEETWFFEALAECYLPLVRMLDRLAADNVPVRLTLTLSPTLICMLGDVSLNERFRNRLSVAEALARADAEDSNGDHAAVAAWHASFFSEMRTLFEERCAGDVLSVFAQFRSAGTLEIGTTTATHAFLPAFQTNPAIVRAQLGVGIDTFTNAFGFRPEFFWLPECGFYPGLDDILNAFELPAFGLESHGITQSKPPSPSLHLPVRCPGGIRCLGRDAELSRLVWSAAQGYPGHADYREFHRDRIHELPESIISQWMEGVSPRLPVGLKYWRVTNPGEEKNWYDPELAAQRAQEHAGDFISRLSAASETQGIWFAPFDAELFGHWWFEGPLWLEKVVRLVATTPGVCAETATRATNGWKEPHDARPAASTWGRDGDNSFWVNRDTAWLYPQLNRAARNLETLVSRFGDRPAASLEGRALRQAARTLLLAESSDWPFMIKAGTAAEAAKSRLAELLARFETLSHSLEDGSIDNPALRECESANAAFPDLDIKRFQ